jgi:hypothetical protein
MAASGSGQAARQVVMFAMWKICPPLAALATVLFMYMDMQRANALMAEAVANYWFAKRDAATHMVLQKASDQNLENKDKQVNAIENKQTDILKDSQVRERVSRAKADRQNRNLRSRQKAFGNVYSAGVVSKNQNPLTDQQKKERIFDTTNLGVENFNNQLYEEA